MTRQQTLRARYVVALNVCLARLRLGRPLNSVSDAELAAFLRNLLLEADNEAGL